MLRFARNDSSKMPDSIVIAPYPVADDKAIDPEAERVMDCVTEVIRSIRNARAEHKVRPDRWIEAEIYTGELLPHLIEQKEVIEKLALVKALSILSRQERRSDDSPCLILVLKEAEVVLPWAGMVDVELEKKKLAKESEITQARLKEIEARLRDDAFLSKASPHALEKEKQRLDTLKDKLKRLHQELSQLPGGGGEE